LLELLKWPSVVIIGALMFRSAIITLIARARRAAFGDKSVEFLEPAASASEQKKQTGVAVIEQAPPPAQGGVLPAPAEALAPFEAIIKNNVAQFNAPDEIKIAWLIRGLAVEQIRRYHEVHYRLILGSQITLLLKVNMGGMINRTIAREIYDIAKAAYPVIYTNFSFEHWIVWPKNVGLINFANDMPWAEITITPAGKDFLHYLVEAGLTGDKPG
jgi:hypothetical protein